MKKNIVLVLLLIVVGIGAFFGGMKYQQNKQPKFNRQFNIQGGQGQQIQQGQGQGVQSQLQGRAGFRPLSGEITSSDGKSITVKLQDGSSRIVILPEKLQINKASEAVKEDLKVGETVMVTGTENSDGSVTAQNIQLGMIERFVRLNITTTPVQPVQ